MRLTVRILGTEIFHVGTDPEQPEDTSRDLSGGVTASIPISMTWLRGSMDHEPESPYEDD